MDFTASSVAPLADASDNRLDSNSSDHGFDPPAVAGKMGSPRDSIWRNVKICARVEELWKCRSSAQIASVISDEFDISVTRNAVIGYLHRAKLTSAHKTEDHPLARSSKKRQRTSAQLGAERRTVNRLRAPRVKPVPFLVSNCTVEPLNISLMELTEATCRWPAGEGAAVTFCGHKPSAGFPYCPAHCALGYKPPERRAAA